MPTSIDYKQLRKQAHARYWVQWVTKFDDTDHITQVLGFCVRDKKSTGWKVVFEHKEEIVCQKIADILNEGS